MPFCPNMVSGDNLETQSLGSYLISLSERHTAMQHMIMWKAPRFRW